MQQLEIINDPIKFVLMAFEELYDVRNILIQFAQEIEKTKSGEEAYGITYFPDNNLLK